MTDKVEDPKKNNNFIYIVTSYGCNSDPSSLWTPCSKLFNNFDDAYEYFKNVCPDTDDIYNKTKSYINESYYNNPKLYESINSDNYIIIENIVQIDGYHYGDENCAKRPFGTSIGRYTL